MPETRVARFFENGECQAAQLPEDVRLDDSDVFETRELESEEEVLSSRPGWAWLAFFEFMRSVKTPEDFMAERPMNRPPKDKLVLEEG